MKKIFSSKQKKMAYAECQHDNENKLQIPVCKKIVQIGSYLRYLCNIITKWK